MDSSAILRCCPIPPPQTGLVYRGTLPEKMRSCERSIPSSTGLSSHQGRLCWILGLVGVVFNTDAKLLAQRFQSSRWCSPRGVSKRKTSRMTNVPLLVAKGIEIYNYEHGHRHVLLALRKLDPKAVSMDADMSSWRFTRPIPRRACRYDERDPCYKFLWFTMMTIMMVLLLLRFKWHVSKLTLCFERKWHGERFESLHNC